MEPGFLGSAAGMWPWQHAQALSDVLAENQLWRLLLQTLTPSDQPHPHPTPETSQGLSPNAGALGVRVSACESGEEDPSVPSMTRSLA